MLNKTFDLDKVIYANNNSKITLSSKKKLDKLTAQVDMWNSEFTVKSSNKENLPILTAKINTKPRVSSSKNSCLLSNNNDIMPTVITLTETTKSKSFKLDGKLSVKNRKAYFESLINENESQSHVTNPSENISFTETGNLPPPRVPENNKSYFELEVSILELSQCDESLENSKVTNGDESGESKSKISQEVISYTTSDSEQSHITDLESEYSIFNLSRCDESLENYEVSNEGESEISQEVISYTTSESEESHTIDSNNNELCSDNEQLPNTTDIGADKEHTEQEAINLHCSLSLKDELNTTKICADFDSSVNASENIPDENKTINDTQLPTENSLDNFVVSEESIIICQMGHLKEKRLHLMNGLFVNYRFTPVDVHHIEKCVEILRNNLMYSSLAESLHHQHYSNDSFHADAYVRNIMFSIKDEYVFYNFKSLLDKGFGDKIKRLSSVYHVILVGRSVGGSRVYESEVFSIIKKCDADKIKLYNGMSQWLRMIKTLDFTRLPINFKLNFELYCMHVNPKKHDKEKPLKKSTQLLFRRTTKIAGPVLFTNIGSLNLTPREIIKNGSIQKNIIVHQSSPLDGFVKLTSLVSLISGCQGKLEVYSEVNNIGSWSFMDCELTTKGIIGGKKSKETGIIENINFEISFNVMKNLANLCCSSAFSKAHSFSVLLNKEEIEGKMPVNRRISINGTEKYTFLAAAKSPEDALRWCKCINLCRDSF